MQICYANLSMRIDIYGVGGVLGRVFYPQAIETLN